MEMEFLVAFKGHITKRLLEDSITWDPNFVHDGRRRKGLEVQTTLDRYLAKYGLDADIEDARRRLRYMETGEGKLKGKHVIEGELVRVSPKRRQYTRCLGVVAHLLGQEVVQRGRGT
jgi:hypothetical protein